MANLFVLAFDSETGASRALTKVEELQKQELIQVEDAAVAIHPKSGKVKIKQSSSLTSAAAVGGAFWGMLFGLIFFVPFAGMAIGALSGALMGKLADYGIDDGFIKRVSKTVTPGTSALFLLVQSAQREKVIESLKPFKGKLIQSSLSPEEEKQLEKAMAA